MLENELVLNLLFNAANVDSVAAPVGNGELDKLTGTALALNCVSVRPCTRLLSTGTRPPLKAGVLVSIEFRLVFPVVCKVAVLAPVGKLTVPLILLIFQVPLWVAAKLALSHINIQATAC